MKPINQIRFSIHVILPALFCFAMTSSALAADTLSQRDHQKIDPIKLADNTTSETENTSDNPESDADKEAERQALRQKMIEHCEANLGTDCERAVDTELGAQDLDIVHTSPPDTMDRIPPRPRPRPRAR